MVALPNSNGAIQKGYKYRAYGEATVLTGSGNDATWFTSDDVTDTVSAIGNPYTFTGRRLDSETMLLYFRNRMYRPDAGIFISRDPIGYVNGMSLHLAYFAPQATDPLGLLWYKPWTWGLGDLGRGATIAASERLVLRYVRARGERYAASGVWQMMNDLMGELLKFHKGQDCSTAIRNSLNAIRNALSFSQRAGESKADYDTRMNMLITTFGAVDKGTAKLVSGYRWHPTHKKAGQPIYLGYDALTHFSNSALWAHRLTPGIADVFAYGQETVNLLIPKTGECEIEDLAANTLGTAWSETLEKTFCCNGKVP